MAINPLNADMDVVQKLVIPGLDSDMDVIQKLDDEPNDVGGLSPAQLKAEFDKAGNITKNYINGTLLPAISDTVVEAEVRAEAEAGRAEAETEREEAEEARAAAEAARVAAEEARAAAEAARVTAEQGRVVAETQREAAEAARAAAEAARTATEAARVTAEQGRETAETQRGTAEAARAAAEAARVEEHTGTIAQAREAAKAEAERAKWEADRAHQIAGGEFTTHLELEGVLSRKADIPLVGPAAMAEELEPGGLLVVTDDADPEDYDFPVERLEDEGDKAYAGQGDVLEELLTVGRVNAMNLRKNAAGEKYAEADMPALAAAIRAMCVAAQEAGGVYTPSGKTRLTYRQIQYYLLHGELVSHNAASEETWQWYREDAKGEHTLLRDEMAGLKEGMESLGEEVKSKQSKITGTPGAFLGFDEDGELAAKSLDQMEDILAGVNAGAALNMFRNWYLADPINQRRQKSYTGTGHGLDGWHIGQQDGAVVTVEDGATGLSLPGGALFEQVVEGSTKRLEGRAFTVSYLTDDGQLLMGTVTVQSIGETAAAYLTVYGTNCEIRLQNKGTFLVASLGPVAGEATLDIGLVAAMMEPGDRQNLAVQDGSGSWALRIPPPDKANELLKCQRYYRPQKLTLVGRVTSETQVEGYGVVPGDMREGAVYKLTSAKLILSTGEVECSAESITLQNADGRLLATVSGLEQQTAGEIGVLLLDGAWVAEISPRSAMAELAWEGDEEQISTICKSKLTKYISSKKKPALTADTSDVELQAYISDQYVQLVGDPGEHQGLIELTDLWVKQDEYGMRNATISINGVTVSYKGKTEDEDHSGGITVPITFDYGVNNIITGKQGLLYVTVSPEDTSAPSKQYVILVRRRENVSDIESVGFTSEQRTAELQHTASGEVETLGLAEAQEKYDSLPFSAPMSDMEKAFYYDNGDPATGKPIRRIVYRGRLTSTDLKNSRLLVQLTGKDSKSTAYLMTNVTATDKVPGYSPTKNQAQYDNYISAAERSFIQPLEEAKGTTDWDKVFIRVYGEVRSEAVEGGLDGGVSYMVLELGISKRGNYKIARVKTDEGGGVLRDSEGEAQLVPAGTLTKKDDVYAVWVCETGQDHKTAQPNVEVVSWTTTPNNIADVEYEGESYPGSDPITNPTGNYFEEVGVPGRAGGVSPENRDPFLARISSDATEITVTVRTEDPTSLVDIGYAVTDGEKDALSLGNYKAGGMSKTFSIDPNAFGVVYIHVKSQNLANQAYNYKAGSLLYGRLYQLDLEKREEE